MSIVYTDGLADVTAEDFAEGFFAGWPNPPDRATHLRLLQGSRYCWLARVAETGQVVGFITALSDGVLTAFIPLLEVVPAQQGQGIGTHLVQRMLTSLAHLYSVDIVCDADLQPFYTRLGFTPYTAMIRRHYPHQGGSSP